MDRKEQIDMKKLLVLVLIILTHAEYAQDYLLYNPATKNTFYNAIDFDGSSEYLYRNYSAADSFLNLNGYERIQNSNSRDFESTVGSWLNKGNHAIDTNTANKIFGNKSGRIIASGAGDSLANFVCMVAGGTSYHGVTANNKYTVELWNKSIHAAAGDSFVIYHGGLRKAFLCSTTLQKSVFNYTASSFTVARDTLKIYTKSVSGDTLIIDSVNISQAYDYVVEGWFYSRSGVLNYLFGKVGNLNYANLIYHDAVLPYIYIKDSVTTATANSQSNSLSFNQWNYFCAYKTSDSIAFSINGVFGNKSTAISNVGSNKDRRYGWSIGANFSGANPTNGYIGEIRWTRFDNLRQSNWTTTTPLTTFNSYTRGVGFTNTYSGGNPKVMLWFDFVGNTDAEMLKDISGNGYHLTGMNVMQNGDQHRWRR